MYTTRAASGPEVKQGADYKRTKITSYHGQQSWWCKECGGYVQVAELVTGQSPSPYCNKMIDWEFLVGECGHTVRDFSH